MKIRYCRQPGPKEIPLEEGEIKKLYTREAWTTREIAEKYGVSQSTIIRRLKKLGVRMRRMAWM